MKRGGTILASLLLLLGTAGLIAMGGERVLSEAETVNAWLLETQLGSLATLETSSADATEKEKAGETAAEEAESEPSPEQVPVETVEEAWDEEARVTAQEMVSPEPVTLGDEYSLELRNETDYEINFTELPSLPQGLTLETEEPVVLIMHTHGSESYTDPDTADYRTSDPEKSVIAVGEKLADVLEARGYGTVHDTTICDDPEFTGAYTRSRQVIEDNLAAYPSIVLVLDIHRDAVEDTDGSQMRMACTLDTGEAAQLMLVVGTDAGGLEHPNWESNLSLAALLQARLSAAAPGLMRPLNLRTERFNQDLGNMSLLVEVGASGNSLEEALTSAELLGQAISDQLDQYCGKSS